MRIRIDVDAHTPTAPIAPQRAKNGLLRLALTPFFVVIARQIRPASLMVPRKLPRRATGSDHVLQRRRLSEGAFEVEPQNKAGGRLTAHVLRNLDARTFHVKRDDFL